MATYPTQGQHTAGKFTTSTSCILRMSVSLYNFISNVQKLTERWPLSKKIIEKWEAVLIN